MSDQSDRIYQGFWKDWSQDPNDQLILTLSPQMGTLLVAFFAVFVTWVGGHLWGIIRLAAHSFLATHDGKDGLHHMRQAIIRTSETVGGSMWSLIRLCWSWRRRKHNATLRSLPFLIVGLAHLLGFTAAGIFSSKSTQTGGAVLLSSSKCGLFDIAAMEHTSFAAAGDAVYQYTAALASSSTSWARSCYAQSDSDFSGGRGCAGFPKRTVGQRVRHERAECPFDDSMCNEGRALMLDTGYISSEDFGFNTKSEERVWFRKVTTWSAINTANHTTTTTRRSDLVGTEAERTNGVAGEMFTLYWLGNIDLLGHDVNWTFAASNYTGHYDSGYEIVPMAFYSGDPDFEWTPIPALARTDADITIIRKSNLVNYIGRVNDPWFRATTPHNDSRAGGNQLYKSSEPFSVLAVTEQYQYCASSNGTGCSELTGNYLGNFSEPAWSQFNQGQKDVLAILTEAAYFSNMRTLTYHLGREVLLAHGFLLSLEVAVSVQLPDTQWMLEAENMHNSSLAMIQHKVVELPSPRNITTMSNGTEYRTSQFLSPLEQVSNKKLASAARLCQEIRVHDFEFQSFSMLAVEIMASIGVLIILLNCVLADVVMFFSTRFNWRVYQTLEWIETGIMQLQRTVFELRGIGPWRKRLGAAPVTERSVDAWVGIAGSQQELLAQRRASELMPMLHDPERGSAPERFVADHLRPPRYGQPSRNDSAVSNDSESLLAPRLSDDPEVRGYMTQGNVESHRQDD